MKKLLIVSLIIILGALILWFRGRKDTTYLPVMTVSPTHSTSPSPDINVPNISPELIP